MARQDIIEKYSYLIDSKINKWTVLNIVKIECDGIRPFAICECECGTIKPVLIKNIINHPKLKHLPFYLETPNEEDGYKEEIELLKSLRG